MTSFIETRGNDGVNPKQVTFSTAILSPMCSFGGIYVPEHLPSLDSSFLTKHLSTDYKCLAREILTAFEIDIEAAAIEQALALYDHFDQTQDHQDPAPLVKVKEDLYVSELYHGPTRAFKDMALQPFGSILSSLAKQRDEKYLILAATSGDTGPAALETFKNRDNVQVVCLYPIGGTSDVQRLQMVTEDAKNLKVIGIHGDFDDAQNALKSLLSSDQFNQSLEQKNISLSAANSVNFGRIIFQIIYHIHSYLELIRQQAITLGEKVYLDVPSGNFGNALGGYYAMKMGLPVEKILIASNQNNILTQLINTGLYDLRDSSVTPTTSPAMDILKSSNVERVLYDFFGAERCRELMQNLDQAGYYQLDQAELTQLQTIFAADYCTDDEGRSYIKQAYADGYLMDPHTATCFKAYENCREKALTTIVYSTAEWTKFSPTIADALLGQSGMDDQSALQAIAEQAQIKIPSVVNDLFDKTISQTTMIDKQQIEQQILAFLA